MPALGALNIVYSDVPKDVQEEIVHAAGRALKAMSRGELRTYSDAAAAVRKDCIAKVAGTWHVIMGPSFGSYVTHETNNLLYFFLGATGVLAFKHG